MSPVESIELEWNYSPLNYLEETIQLEYDGISIEIKDGKVTAKITPETFEQSPSIQKKLQDIVESRFHAVQIFNHKNYELSKPSRTDLRQDGKKHHYLQLESLTCKISVGTMDFVVKDKHGNVKSDTKRERIDKQQWYAETMEKHRKTDTTLQQLISSYQMSVKDPDNEFVHLYEIRDALVTRFTSKKNALRELNITDDQWDEIGKLANALPIKQGRHRGKAFEGLSTSLKLRQT
ncbi:hypothetical protein [Thalassotalea sp. PP2-459]|uniref:hypothetical protein n=1 Tax=Thalassotalea sp. PP2-459 TaxID=1742724 RepID=UPI0009429FA3|nr:hypothetical protein [Thalassotalea sp. PP2-459]OKY25658.1 hypothetical protein BI291_15125 [Thalassotalea sp. PP2-459]